MTSIRCTLYQIMTFNDNFFQFFVLSQNELQDKIKKKETSKTLPAPGPTVEPMNAPPHTQLEDGQGISNTFSHLSSREKNFIFHSVFGFILSHFFLYFECHSVKCAAHLLCGLYLAEIKDKRINNLNIFFEGFSSKNWIRSEQTLVSLISTSEPHEEVEVRPHLFFFFFF